MADIEKIKVRIAKLAAVTMDNGSTENEVEKALSMIASLLEEYNLTMSEVEAKNDPLSKKSFYTGYKVKLANDTSVMKIAMLTDCLAWYSRDDKRFLSYNFFGMEHDALMAVHLMTIIHRALHVSTDAFKETPQYFLSAERRKAFTSFQYGFVTKINRRIDELIAHKTAAEEAQMDKETTAGGKSTALVLTLKTERIEKEMKAKFGFVPKARKGKRRAHLLAAFQAGQAAGDTVNLSRPITHSAKGLYLS